MGSSTQGGDRFQRHVARPLHRPLIVCSIRMAPTRGKHRRDRHSAAVRASGSRDPRCGRPPIRFLGAARRRGRADRFLRTAVGRTLRVGYEAAPRGGLSLARPTTARDFHTKLRVQLGEAPTLEKVNESGEFKSGGMAEARESYKVDTFGRIISLSRGMR